MIVCVVRYADGNIYDKMMDERTNTTQCMPFLVI